MLNYLRYITAFAILLCCVPMVTAQTTLLRKGRGQCAPIKEKRDTVGINPFKVAVRVELLQYSKRMQWW